jgi:DNA-binding response OmpR family regulator
MTPAHHILVVEDSTPLSDAFRIMLERSGYRVSVANSISAALEVPEQADVLLLDLSLPDGDGTQLLDRLVSLGRKPGVTIALTGREDNGTRDRCLDAGCSEVLVKPVASRVLVQRVSGLLGSKARAQD